MSPARAAVVMLAFTAMLTGGCQTTSETSDSASPASKIVFVPRARQATIQAQAGRYPNLFTGASYALWDPGTIASVSPPTPVAGSANANTAETMNDDMESLSPPPLAHASRAGGLTIECKLESEFPDMSTAYDAVGLRGMMVTLKLPDGHEIQPAQKRLDADLQEVAIGALRRYSRKLTLYFPDRTFMVENPAINPAAPGIQLVLSGHDSSFIFEWSTTPDFLAVPASRIDKEAAKAARTYVKSTRDAVQRTSHRFD